LVARWLIERENGNRVVQQLVMVGTPNAGSPWPTLQDWATAAISFGLNALTAAAWPAQVLGVLAGALETADVAFDEMCPGSELLHELEASDDPGVRYAVISGSTSLVPAALEATPGQSTSRFERLWARIMPRNWFLHALTGPAFFGQPNDMAVSVASVQAVPADRTPPPILLPPAACDHITYFDTVEGLAAIAEAAR
jgi:hypothetical protein